MAVGMCSAAGIGYWRGWRSPSEKSEQPTGSLDRRQDARERAPDAASCVTDERAERGSQPALRAVPARGSVPRRMEKEPHSPTTHGRSRNTAIEAEPAGGGP